jgi:hypothetical protein
LLAPPQELMDKKRAEIAHKRANGIEVRPSRPAAPRAHAFYSCRFWPGQTI